LWSRIANNPSERIGYRRTLKGAVGQLQQHVGMTRRARQTPARKVLTAQFVQVRRHAVEYVKHAFMYAPLHGCL
jgi:plasmid stabilization system protein ParE